jgi:WD40 repeat protein
LRSAALVRRGLRDLARDSNWLLRKVFSGPVSHAAVSPDGQVCTLSPTVRHGAQTLTLFDIERCVPTLTLNLAPHTEANAAESPARFAWSPDARYLLGAWGTHHGALQLFDLQAKALVGELAKFSRVPANIAWSPTGALIASSCAGETPSLELWQLQPPQPTPSDGPAALIKKMGIPDWLDLPFEDSDSAEAGISGYGPAAFSPDENSLAAVFGVGGEWADDMIVLLDALTFRKKAVYEVQGRVTDIAWSNDGKRLVYCSAGQAYGIDPLSAECTPLPFGGEQCAWHPHLPVCLFFSSWLRSSAKGRLFLADMNRITVFDEYPAEGILDLRWSQDGSKAYAITTDGLAYIYEPELL